MVNTSKTKASIRKWNYLEKTMQISLENNDFPGCVLTHQYKRE